MSASFFQESGPKAPAGTPGVAADSNAPGHGGQQAAPGPSSLLTFLPFLVLIPILLMSFRRQKKEQEARKNLKKGDRVVTQAGLIGELMEMDDRVAKVKIAPGTTVQVLATALSSFEASTASSKSDKDLQDLKEAKAAADKK